MQGPETLSLWRKRVAAAVLFCLMAGSTAAAQTPETSKLDLEGLLRPGMTVWITDAAGQEKKSRIVGLSGGVLTATSGEAVWRLPAADVRRVRVRQSDSLMNGALIGAGAALASGLLLCTAMEPWENCRDDVGPLLRIGALGAGIGIGVDALIRGRQTIYEADRRASRVRVAPMIGRQGRGLRLAISF